MKTRLTAWLLALTMVWTLSACGNAPGGVSAESGSASSSVSDGAETTPPADAQGPASSDTGEEPPAEETPVPQLPEAETKPAGDTAAKPSGPAKPSGGTAAKPQKPSGGTSAGGAASGGAASGGGASSSGGSSSAGSPTSRDLAAFYETLSAGDGFPAMTAVTGEALDALYAGLGDLSPLQCLVYMPMISAVACEVALAEAASAADVEKIQAIFQARIDYQIQQGAFYPATVEAWKSQSQIVTAGNFVMLVCWDQADTAAESFRAQFQ